MVLGTTADTLAVVSAMGAVPQAPVCKAVLQDGGATALLMQAAEACRASNRAPVLLPLLLQGVIYWVREPTSAAPLHSGQTWGGRQRRSLVHQRGDSADSLGVPAEAAIARTRPIVFFHGVGLGLVSGSCCTRMAFGDNR